MSLSALESSKAFQYALIILFSLVTVYNIIAYILTKNKLQRKQREMGIKIQAEQEKVQQALKESF